jgi:hypothetical protein
LKKTPQNTGHIALKLWCLQTSGDKAVAETGLIDYRRVQEQEKPSQLGSELEG